MLVHHRGNHGGAGAKDGSDGGGGFTGRGHAEEGGGGRGGGGGGGGRLVEQISVPKRRAELGFREKPWTDRTDRERENIIPTFVGGFQTSYHIFIIISVYKKLEKPEQIINNQHPQGLMTTICHLVRSDSLQIDFYVSFGTGGAQIDLDVL